MNFFSKKIKIENQKKNSNQNGLGKFQKKMNKKIPKKKSLKISKKKIIK